jgi:hypothetical protein
LQGQEIEHGSALLGGRGIGFLNLFINTGELLSEGDAVLASLSFAGESEGYGAQGDHHFFITDFPALHGDEGAVDDDSEQFFLVTSAPMTIAAEAFFFAAGEIMGVKAMFESIHVAGLGAALTAG